MTAKNARLLDKLGIGVSLSCAVHCALLPIVIGLLPFLGLKFLANRYLELVIILISMIIACSSLIIAYMRHKKPTALLIALTGFICIMIGHYFFNSSYEWLPLTVGGSVVAYAHYKNIMFNKYHKKCTC